MSPGDVFAAVADLATYPGWLSVVLDAVEAPRHGADAGPAWHVDLGVKIGPFRQAKRVRMVRVLHDPDERVRFERHEHDGEAHPPWMLEAEVRPSGAGSALTVRLHYGGDKMPALAEHFLGEEVRKGPGRLEQRLVQGRA